MCLHVRNYMNVTKNITFASGNDIIFMHRILQTDISNRSNLQPNISIFYQLS